MADFTIDALNWTVSEEDIAYWKLPRVRADFGWWCLGHSFDVVGAILSMAHLSWQKGFDAGRIIANFNDTPVRDFEDYQNISDAHRNYLSTLQ